MENNYQKSIDVFSNMIDIYKSNQSAKKFSGNTISNMPQDHKNQMVYFMIYVSIISLCIGTYFIPNFYVLGNLWLILSIFLHIGFVIATAIFIVITENYSVVEKLRIIGHNLKFFTSKFLFIITNPLRKILIEEQIQEISRDFKDCVIEIGSFFEKRGKYKNFNLLIEEMRLPKEYTINITENLEKELDAFKNVLLIVRKAKKIKF